MSGIQVRTVTHKTIDLTASVTISGYEGSGKVSGTVNIFIADQNIHSLPLNIDGSSSEEAMIQILDGILKEFRQTEKHAELFQYFKGIAKEFYPIFENNDPSMVLEMHKPGFSSHEEISEWVMGKFPEGESYAILNEYGQVCAWEKVKPQV